MVDALAPHNIILIKHLVAYWTQRQFISLLMEELIQAVSAYNVPALSESRAARLKQAYGAAVLLLDVGNCSKKKVPLNASVRPEAVGEENVVEVGEECFPRFWVGILLPVEFVLLPELGTVLVNKLEVARSEILQRWNSFSICNTRILYSKLVVVVANKFVRVLWTRFCEIHRSWTSPLNTNSLQNFCNNNKKYDCTCSVRFRSSSIKSFCKFYNNRPI